MWERAAVGGSRILGHFFLRAHIMSIVEKKLMTFSSLIIIIFNYHLRKLMRRFPRHHYHFLCRFRSEIKTMKNHYRNSKWRFIVTTRAKINFCWLLPRPKSSRGVRILHANTHMSILTQVKKKRNTWNVLIFALFIARGGRQVAFAFALWITSNIIHLKKHVQHRENGKQNENNETTKENIQNLFLHKTSPKCQFWSMTARMKRFSTFDFEFELSTFNCQVSIINCWFFLVQGFFLENF